MRGLTLVLVGLLVGTLCCAGVQVASKVPNKEPTFWSLCYTDSGFPIYPDTEWPYRNDACDKPVEITWKQLPIKVATTDDYRAAEINTLRASIAVWNAWAGGELFAIVPQTDDYDVLVQYGDQDRGDLLSIAAEAPHVVYEGRTFFGIYIYDSGMYNPVTMVHELGHTLGLMHDPDTPRSIMRTGVSARIVPWLTTSDAKALHGKYPGLPFDRSYPDEQ